MIYIEKGNSNEGQKFVPVEDQIDGFRLNRENLVLWNDKRIQKVKIDGTQTALLDGHFPLSSE